MIRKGTARVEVRSLAAGDPTSLPSAMPAYYAQAGAFGRRDNADALAASLRDAGIADVVMVTPTEGRPLFRVRAGPAAISPIWIP